MKMRATIWIVMGLLSVAPLVLGGYELNVLMIALLFSLLAVGLDLVTGYCGQFSFAQGAFFGLGAYTTAIMSRDLGTSFWVNCPAGVIVAGGFGFILGIPALRLKGHFLAIVTIAFQTLTYLVLSQWTSFTGGQSGLSVPSIGPVFIGDLLLCNITSLQSYYWLTLALVVCGQLVAWRLIGSRLGREWVAVRDDEILASALGINPARAKLTAFVASAGMAAAAGVVAAYILRGVTPDDFTIGVSASVVAMMVLGGRGTFVGPLIGAILLTILPEGLGRFAEFKTLIYGLLLVAAITLMPEGVVGLARRVRAVK